MTKTRTIRERNYLKKVEGELFAIYRQAKDMSSPAADVTPTDMFVVMQSALRALKALGQEPKPTEAEAVKRIGAALLHTST